MSVYQSQPFDWVVELYLNYQTVYFSERPATGFIEAVVTDGISINAQAVNWQARKSAVIPLPSASVMLIAGTIQTPIAMSYLTNADDPVEGKQIKIKKVSSALVGSWDGSTWSGLTPGMGVTVFDGVIESKNVQRVNGQLIFELNCLSYGWLDLEKQYPVRTATKSDFPRIPPQNEGKACPSAFGTIVDMPGFAVDVNERARLVGDLSATNADITVDDASTLTLPTEILYGTAAATYSPTAILLTLNCGALYSQFPDVGFLCPFNPTLGTIEIIRYYKNADVSSDPNLVVYAERGLFGLEPIEIASGNPLYLCYYCKIAAEEILALYKTGNVIKAARGVNRTPWLGDAHVAREFLIKYQFGNQTWEVNDYKSKSISNIRIWKGEQFEYKDPTQSGGQSGYVTDVNDTTTSRDGRAIATIKDLYIPLSAVQYPINAATEFWYQAIEAGQVDEPALMKPTEEPLHYSVIAANERWVAPASGTDDNALDYPTNPAITDIANAIDVNDTTYATINNGALNPGDPKPDISLRGGTFSQGTPNAQITTAIDAGRGRALLGVLSTSEMDQLSIGMSNIIAHYVQIGYGSATEYVYIDPSKDNAFDNEWIANKPANMTDFLTRTLIARRMFYPALSYTSKLYEIGIDFCFGETMFANLDLLADNDYTNKATFTGAVDYDSNELYGLIKLGSVIPSLSSQLVYIGAVFTVKFLTGRPTKIAVGRVTTVDYEGTPITYTQEIDGTTLFDDSTDQQTVSVDLTSMLAVSYLFTSNIGYLLDDTRNYWYVRMQAPDGEVTELYQIDIRYEYFNDNNNSQIDQDGNTIIVCTLEATVDDANGTYTGTPYALITHPASIFHKIMADMGLSSQVDATNLALVRTYTNIPTVLNGAFVNQEMVMDLLVRIFLQCGLFPMFYHDKYLLKPFPSSTLFPGSDTSKATFGTWNMGTDTLQVSYTSVRDVVNNLIIRYGSNLLNRQELGWSPFGVKQVGSERLRRFNPGMPDWVMNQKLRQSYNYSYADTFAQSITRYGNTSIHEVNADFLETEADVTKIADIISDKDAAVRMLVSFETLNGYADLPFTPLDVITVAHPQLPLIPGSMFIVQTPAEYVAYGYPVEEWLGAKFVVIEVIELSKDIIRINCVQLERQ